MNDGWDLSSSDPIKSGREILSLWKHIHPRPLPQHETLSFVHTHTHTHSLRWASLFSFSIFINLLFFFTLLLFLSLSLSLWGGVHNSIVFHLLVQTLLQQLTPDQKEMKKSHSAWNEVFYVYNTGGLV